MVRGKIVDEYIANSPDWAQSKLQIVRQIAIDLGLKETVKWGAPVYVYKTNVVGLGAFKNWVSIWFFQGVFLANDEKVLLAAQDKTKGLRQWRFLPEEEVPVDLMKKYIIEAMDNDEKGLKVISQKNAKPLDIPDTLKEALKAKKGLFEQFSKLSAAQQHEYCEFINEAKREDTKVRRVQKSLDLISSNKGLNDKYKK